MAKIKFHYLRLRERSRDWVRKKCSHECNSIICTNGEVIILAYTSVQTTICFGFNHNHFLVDKNLRLKMSITIKKVLQYKKGDLQRD